MIKNPDDAAWCRKLFNTIRVGGTWGVPRSGLIFNKRDEQTLVLVSSMPWMKEIGEAAALGRDVPMNKEEFLLYQRADFDIIADRFSQAGILVTGKEVIK